MKMTTKKLASALGGLAAVGTCIFGMAPAANANTITTSRAPYELPNVLGTLTNGSTTVANVSAETNFTGAYLFVDHQLGSGTWDLNNFTINCLAGDEIAPGSGTFNRTDDYAQYEQCTAWGLGNVLIEADFELSAP